nr:uncharacterized protein LOC112547243 [Pelodiscus sinensis]|eukprot:XP_025044857.1 uncharacterized protein LOC112547243 [Pelodiscus sinensis]
MEERSKPEQGSNKNQHLALAADGGQDTAQDGPVLWPSVAILMFLSRAEMYLPPAVTTGPCPPPEQRVSPGALAVSSDQVKVQITVLRPTSVLSVPCHKKADVRIRTAEWVYFSGDSTQRSCQLTATLPAQKLEFSGAIVALESGAVWGRKENGCAAWLALSMLSSTAEAAVLSLCPHALTLPPAITAFAGPSPRRVTLGLLTARSSPYPAARWGRALGTCSLCLAGSGGPWGAAGQPPPGERQEGSDGKVGPSPRGEA